eukprot:TRINITY_DN3967_c0_g1_i1.p1 TRINITY_DN3967_c0_g1~~TRINITY_DN3967_c0_g1_i1.p1  ORF type:complete len:349 (+),score=115.37 TRINITY_DN3967_c0_g1_i1:107-1153(+)
MKMMRKGCLCTFLSVLAIATYLRPVEGKPKKDAAVWKQDIKYIQCGVCEEIVKQLTRQVKKKREEIAPKKLSELEIIEIAEKICDLKRENGEWIQYLDMVEDGNKIKLVEQPGMGECNSECKTIQRTCELVMGEHDTDVAELLYGGGERSALQKLLCRDLSKSCSGKILLVPKDRKPGEEFVPKPEKEVDVDRMMKSMADMPGAPGMKAYSRDELMSGNIPGMEDLEDDDDDDEDSPKKQMREAMATARAKQEQKKKEKEQVKEEPVKDEKDAVKEFVENMRGQAQKLTDQVQTQAGKAVKAAQGSLKKASDWVGSLMGGGKGGKETSREAAKGTSSKKKASEKKSEL